MKLTFHGACDGVTGSCSLLEIGRTRLLIDCGMFQGKDAEERNTQPFGFDPSEIDYVLLTHAHLDHSGRLPLLVRQGFRGEIIATSATRELTKLVLLDAARLQEEEAAREARHGRRRNRRVVRAMYTTADVENVLDRFGRIAVYNRTLPLADNIRVTFFDAGHILGSASIFIEARGRSIVFSGDIGNCNKPVVRDPVPPPPADFVVMETTYGDRCHRSIASSVEELFAAIRDTFARGGNVLVPSFAVGRAQELLFYLREGVESGRLPDFMQVFLDSPMAISATEIFRRHPECHDAETTALFQSDTDPFDIPGLHYTRDVTASMAINRFRSGALIIAGSGMCSGGRILHHLRHNLWREECSIVFIGFAARGTLARQIIDGASEVRIFGEPIKVRARIHTINGFSAHADHNELMAWHRHLGTPTTTYLVHGDDKAIQRMAHDLRKIGRPVELPECGTTYRL